MSSDWPREIAGHVIDREVTLDVREDADAGERFHCVDCGRTFEEEPDPERLRSVPCDPRPLER